jgi:hypothetical protein
MDYRFWAILWLCMSFVLTVAGIVFARDARETLWMKGRTQDGVTPYDQSNYCSPEISVGPRRDDVESGNNNNNNNKTMTIAAVY